eukprot:9481064-Pyramimonas_sp.AAC.1
MPPAHVLPLAAEHDASIVDTFRTLFQLPSDTSWDRTLHGVDYDTWILQACLPVRLSGMGLRSVQRTSNAAYWASWADVLPTLMDKFPIHGRDILQQLNTRGARNHIDLACLDAAECAGARCDEAGWTARPSWIDLAAGARPPEPARHDH